ncbi:hypothetical protein EAF04_005287 [Stromatinia cepivora]|nr:hypothetical protein EAF04_005287 [Stromatinia cepivora]
MGQDQEEPLLSSSEVQDELSQEREAHHAAKESTTEVEEYRPASGRTKRYRNWHILSTVGLVICYIPAILLFIASGARFHRHAANSEPLPDIAKEAKIFEIQKFPSGFRSSPYAGPPSEELDAAWHELFEYNDIRVELEDLQAIGMESLPLQQGGYIAQPGVFHELHCLKRIRHWIYRDHYIYPKGPSDAELKEWEAHIHHCIERLRLSMMCRGDTSLAIYKWLKEGDEFVPTITDVGPHQCINWENFSGWIKDRSVNLSEPGLLVPRY